MTAPQTEAVLLEGTVAYRDLREFIGMLEKKGELQRVRAEVDPVLEITEVVQRLGRDAIPRRLKSSAKQAGHVGPKGPTPSGLGPALLFERPKGSGVPLLIHAFGSLRRMELAFEVNALEEAAER